MGRSSTNTTTKSLAPHEVLGVPADASEEQIRSAYRHLALKWHPDRLPDNTEGATAMFVEINKANCTMIREIRRARRAARSTPSSSVAGSSPSSPESTSGHLPPESPPQPSETTPNESQVSSAPSPPIAKEASCSSSNTATTKRVRRSKPSREDTPRGQSPSRSSLPRSDKPSGSKLTKPRPNPKPSTAKSAPCASSSSPSKTRRSSLQAGASLTYDVRVGEILPKSLPSLSTPGVTAQVGQSRDEETLSPPRSVLHSAVSDVPKKWTHNLNVTLEDINNGKTFHFRIVRYKQSGQRSVVPLDLYVPPGTRGGTEIILEGAGNERKDGTRQSIALLVKEMKHERFRRVHSDLVLDVKIPWVDSLDTEGGKVYFQGLDGKEHRFKIPYHKDGLLSGKTVIKDAGLPLRGREGKGKIIVHWEISSPLSSWDAFKNVLLFKG